MNYHVYSEYAVTYKPF